MTAYASITHRVTGVLMFFSSFLMLWALDQSLASEASFNAVAAVLSSPIAKVISWGIASVLTYHALAGIKHLIMDAGIGETMRGVANFFDSVRMSAPSNFLPAGE